MINVFPMSDICNRSMMPQLVAAQVGQELDDILYTPMEDNLSRSSRVLADTCSRAASLPLVSSKTPSVFA